MQDNLQGDVDILFAEIEDKLRAIAVKNQGRYINTQAAVTVAYKTLRVRLNTKIEIIDRMNEIADLERDLEHPVKHL